MWKGKDFTFMKNSMKQGKINEAIVGGIKGLYIGSCLSILDEYPSHVYYQKILETVYVSLTRSIFENLCIHKKKTDEELIQIINDEYVNWLKKTEKFFSKQHLLYKILCLPIVFGMDITKTPHDLGKIAFEANKDVDIDVAILSYLMVNFSTRKIRETNKIDYLIELAVSDLNDFLSEDSKKIDLKSNDLVDLKNRVEDGKASIVEKVFLYPLYTIMYNTKFTRFGYLKDHADDKEICLAYGFLFGIVHGYSSMEIFKFTECSDKVFCEIKSRILFLIEEYKNEFDFSLLINQKLRSGNKNGNNLLFLDLDGVIFTDFFDNRQKIIVLNKLCRSYECSIVLTSSLRKNYDKYKNILIRMGIKAPIIGRTPLDLEPREVQILEYLDKVNDYNKVLILDDMELKGFDRYAVKIDEVKGLTMEDYKKALKLLAVQENELQRDN